MRVSSVPSIVPGLSLWGLEIGSPNTGISVRRDPAGTAAYGPAGATMPVVNIGCAYRRHRVGLHTGQHPVHPLDTEQTVVVLGDWGAWMNVLTALRPPDEQASGRCER